MRVISFIDDKVWVADVTVVIGKNIAKRL